MARDLPLGLEAARLLPHARAEGPGGLIHVTTGEDRARGVARFIASVSPETAVLVFPAWDCLPYDAASPSAEAMGLRMSVLRRLAARRGPVLLLTTPEAALQRLPPPEAVEAFHLRTGEEMDLEALRAFCRRAGYAIDERVDEVGEVAFRGEVVDVFPGGRRRPRRLEIGEGRLEAIRSYDPATQRSVEEAETLALDAVSELPLAEEEDDPDQRAGAEHWLPEAYPELATLFDHLPGARLTEHPGAAEARRVALAQIAEAHRDRERAEDAEAAPRRRPLPPERLYLTEDEWSRAAAAAQAAVLEPGDHESVPVFAEQSRPRGAFLAFLNAQVEAGRRVVLAASLDEQAKLKRRLRLPPEQAPVPAEGWREALEAPAGSLLALEAALDQGFVDLKTETAVVAAGDVLGSRAGASEERDAVIAPLTVDLAELHLDDVVVHFDYGVGVLEGLETVEAAGAANDAIRLRYAENQTLLVPAEEAGKLWRYGSAESEVTLDRLDTKAWEKRRAKIMEGIAQTARGLVAAVAERRGRAAPKLEPKQPQYERFVARFPYPPTPDQRRAIDAALADLASGVPMNRLVVGDVGFGKTEVALRAAAAAALAGKQVAVVAPTTVLARQHYDTFCRRFEGLGVEVAHLSRLVAPKEAKRVKAGLADGSLHVAIGTHALLGKGLAFAGLGLLVIDEEQRFGAQHKEKLRSLGENVHVLTMSATPIPRTLQGALVGLQDLSVIATPPLRRRPVRTLLAEYDLATLRQALLREKRRGGQSFVVVPRVEDIEPVADTLRELAPRLRLRIAHGKLPAADADEALVGFAGGRGDVLLATSIIESGLDVPRANTMIVLRPDLFGLAQLHQLRGRVGRSHAQAFCYLMTEAGQELPEATARRLGTVQALDRLGAGMAISLQDLDLRGGGELFGERQAGHVRLIGLGLYQDLLAAALREAKGEARETEAVDLQVAAQGSIPEDYVPEPAVRVNIHHQIARIRSLADVDRLADEIADRFGPPPGPVQHLLAAARVRALARALGVTRVSAGPQGAALSFAAQTPVEDEFGDALARFGGALDWNGERMLYRKLSETPEERDEVVIELLEALA